MISVVSQIKLIKQAVARIGLIAIILWAAVPEVQSYTATINPQLHPKIVKPAVLQVGFTKQHQGNTFAKQLLIIPCIKEEIVDYVLPKLQEPLINLSNAYYNSFYVYTTINAP